MKRDTSNQSIIDLDLHFQSKEPSKIVTEIKDFSKPSVDWDEVMLEWSYRLPKGYPTIVDGVFTEREEVKILNEILEEKFGTSIELPQNEATTKKPIVGNDISLKEGLVCLFYDVLKNKSAATKLKAIQPLLRNKKEILDPKELSAIMAVVSSTYKTNSKYYGAGASMPQNLDLFVDYVLTTRVTAEIETLTNALSAAQAIHDNIGLGRIIRDKSFDDIRSHAVKLIKQDYNITLQADNWCPGDVYLVMDPSAVSAALAAKSVNVGRNSINSVFKKDSGIVAISLKEEKAQAGKATTFAEKVFTNSFKADINPNDKYGTSNNKDLAKLTSKITRFEDYFYGPARGGRRSQSYINAVSKKGVIHGSVNAILKAAGFPTRTSKDLVQNSNEAAFHKANKSLFDDLLKSIAKLKASMGGSDNTKKVESTFVTSRDKFIKDLQKFKIEVTAESNAKFAKAIQNENEDPVSVLSKKTAAYELASLIITRWTDKNAQISPAYKKIQEITNPFVALTAFAIASAGISPSFHKVIGNSKNMFGAHDSWFDAKATVDIDSKTSKIVLVDSVKQAGFLLKYTTLLGKTRYSTKLVFRFSGSEIRIEVQELKEI